jgi:zinc protease
VRRIEPPQQAERRVTLRREGTASYWRAAYHAPAFAADDFFPLLVADAVLSGAAGLNIWAGGRVARSQRSARLYRALVDRGLASGVGGTLAPTAEPFLYTIAATVADGQTAAAVEEVVLHEVGALAQAGITGAELVRARAQLRARFVYDADSVTDIAHQLGYFDTIDTWRAAGDLQARLDEVTADAVQAAAARHLAADNRTIGVFEPL